MSDIVKRLSENVTWLMRDGFETSAKNVQCALTEIESLRKQLAEKDAEIARLKASWQSAAIEDMAKQLAASQAREVQLREALRELLCYNEKATWVGGIENGHLVPVGSAKLNVISRCEELLALPQDTAALSALITKAGEVMREWCESMLRYQGACNHDLLRSIPAVTLDDLKGGEA